MLITQNEYINVIKIATNKIEKKMRDFILPNFRLRLKIEWSSRITSGWKTNYIVYFDVLSNATITFKRYYSIKLYKTEMNLWTLKNRLVEKYLVIFSRDWVYLLWYQSNSKVNCQTHSFGAYTHKYTHILVRRSNW